MSLEQSIAELTAAVKELTLKMAPSSVQMVDCNTTNKIAEYAAIEAEVNPPVVLDEGLIKPVVKKKKVKKKKKAETVVQDTTVGEALLDDEREEVVSEVEVASSVTRDEMMAEASRNIKLQGGDDFLRELLDTYNYAKFPDVPESCIADIYNTIKDKNDE